ncbi:NUDIX hydrolase domain-like protein [Chytridium lagenaria]|nr:NUDIX hydrolase domain-like protein [Chytridium lagenaria]
MVKEVLKRMRNGGASSGKRTFIVLWSFRAVKDARERSYWSSKGVNMVTDSLGSILTVLTMIQSHHSPTPSFFHSSGSQQLNQTLYACPFCGVNLSLHSLSIHVPLYHTQEPGGAVCTICKENVAFLPKHLKENHPIVPESPGGSQASSHRGSRANMGIYLSDDASPKARRSRQPVFALVVVRRPSDGKFLMVDEVARQGWWLPGGNVDVGEDLVKAAERQTFEEAGIKITVKGVLRVEYTPSQHGFRMRIIFYAEPNDPAQKPKTIPDIESAGACWVSLDQLGDHIQLRGREPSLWFPYVAKGGAIWPCPVLSREKDDIKFIPDPFNVRSKSEESLDENDGSEVTSSFRNLRV